MKKVLLMLSAIACMYGTSSAQSQCSAQTYCPNLGTHISCYTFGNGCTFNVVYGQYVQCTGYSYNSWGQMSWVNLYQKCY